MSDTTSDFSTIQNYLAPSEAAAIAVIVANARKNLKELSNTFEGREDVIATFCRIEDMCLETIKENDGEVVSWIGTAAKQLNSLLS